MLHTDPGIDDPQVKKFQKELNAGIISLILLLIMSKAKRDMYGYEIAKQLEKVDQSEPIIKQSALYPVLRSIHASGFLDSHVVPSVSGPPRRYYAITPQGREVLKLWKTSWHRTSDLVNSFIKK
jgi:PadR family transcriptional regulator PadR